MTSSHSYYLVGLVFPLILMLLFYVCSSIAVIAHICKIVAGKGYTRTYRLPQALQLLLRAVFLGLEIRKEEEPEEQLQTIDPESLKSTNKFKDVEMVTNMEATPTTAVYLHNRRLSEELAYTLVFIVVALFGCSTATLWQVLLIESSTNCGEAGFDCFSWGERVTDCSVFENRMTVSVNGTDHRLECYRFCFNYVMAFAAAGGVTFFGGIMINTFTFVTIRLSKMERSRYCKRIIAGIIFAFLFLPIPLIVTVVFVAHTLHMMDILRVIIYSVAYGMSVVANLFIYMYTPEEADHPPSGGYQHTMKIHVWSNEGRSEGTGYCEQSTHVDTESSDGGTDDT